MWTQTTSCPRLALGSVMVVRAGGKPVPRWPPVIVFATAAAAAAAAAAAKACPSRIVESININLLEYLAIGNMYLSWEELSLFSLGG